MSNGWDLQAKEKKAENGDLVIQDRNVDTAWVQSDSPVPIRE